MKKALCILMVLLLALMAVIPSLTAAAADTGDDVVQLEEGTYVPNQVIVMFKDSAINIDTAPDEDDLSAVGAEFGEMMEASSSENEAFSAADEETKILKKNLGNDFILEDTLVFTTDEYSDGDLAPSGASADAEESFTVALVSSEKYDTATLIKKLSKNKNVAAVEPNYITTLQSYDYSLNDPLNWYDYQANTPLDNNTGGDNVSSRGMDQESYLSTNAGYAWNKLTGEEEEIVVAVIDSGLNVYHEDLENMLWTNPGDIELEGEHGFNFQDNATDLTDLVGHGTHCSGIIAAQANNGIGLSGVASKANVKLMMCATASAVDEGDGNGTSYREMAAFNYVLKAKQRGVNIVCTSNSWGSGGESEIYDRAVDMLGEEGVLSFFAAGNDNVDIDFRSYKPAGGNSPYKVVVGAAKLDGSRAGFSNYGRSKVDLFAPGADIVSTVGYACYFPNIESGEKRSETTEYYGLFDQNTVITDGRATPSVTDCDDTVKPFGASVFRVQSINNGETIADSTAVCELSVDTEHTFTMSKSPASLRVSISNVSPGEEYYLYFPYEKNPETTGSDNTDLSVYMMRDSDSSYLDATPFIGEVIINEQGSCSMTDHGYNKTAIDKPHLGLGTHVSNRSMLPSNLVMSYEELGGRQSGVGIKIIPALTDGVQTGTVVFYLDSIAVSKPDAELYADDSYQMMSGTSMATPAAAGAYAALAALYPKREGQTDSEYALENRARLFSIVRKTDELKDLCVTGGYVDLSLIDENNPAFTRVECDLQNEDVILSGINLSAEYTLCYQRRAQADSQPTQLPSGGMTVDFSEDGSTVVIHNAKALFSTYTEFTLSDGTRTVSKICDFLVKGQKHFDLVLEEPYPQTINDNYYLIPPRHVLTDTEGKKLYGFDTSSGTVSKYDGVQFNEIKGTELEEAVRQYLKTQGASDYDIRHNTTVTAEIINSPIYTNNKLFQFVRVSYAPAGETSFYDDFYIASIDYTAENPSWTFEVTESFNGLFRMIEYNNYGFVGADSKIFCIGSGRMKGETKASPYMFSLDLSSGKWTREADPPIDTFDPMLCYKDGKLYLAMGHIWSDQYQEISTAIYCYDGQSWTKNGDIPYIGDILKVGITDTTTVIKGTCIAVKDGLMFLNCPADGGGNAFIYHTDTGVCEPIYYTFTGYKADFLHLQSAVETKEGIYYIEENTDCKMSMFRLYLLPADSGAYTPTYQDKGILGDADGDGRVTVLDATSIQKKLASLPVESFNELTADVDKDGKLTVLDATYIQKFLASMPCPEGIGEPIE